MALQVKALPRQFIYNKDKKEIVLADINQELSAEEVVKFHSGTHPELTNAVIDGPIVKSDKATYNITTKAGKLG